MTPWSQGISVSNKFFSNEDSADPGTTNWETQVWARWGWWAAWSCQSLIAVGQNCARHGLCRESTAVLIDCNLLSLATCWGSYLWNPWNMLLSFWTWQWVNTPVLLYCYLDGLLKDQMGESHGVPWKNRRHIICEMSYFGIEDSSHFQQDIFLWPPTGSHLVAESLLREVWWW